MTHKSQSLLATRFANWHLSQPNKSSLAFFKGVWQWKLSIGTSIFNFIRRNKNDSSKTIIKRKKTRKNKINQNKQSITNTDTKNIITHIYCTTLSGYIFATVACIDNRKKLLNSNISSTCPHYGELRPTNGWYSLTSLGHTSKFQRVLRLDFVTAHRHRSTKVNKTLQDVWPSPGLLQCTFFGALAP